MGNYDDLCFSSRSFIFCMRSYMYIQHKSFFFILSVTNFGISYTIDRGLVFTHSVIVQNFDWMLHFQQWKPRFEFCCFPPSGFFFEILQWWVKQNKLLFCEIRDIYLSCDQSPFTFNVIKIWKHKNKKYCVILLT